MQLRMKPINGRSLSIENWSCMSAWVATSVRDGLASNVGCEWNQPTSSYPSFVKFAACSTCDTMESKRHVHLY